MKIYNEKDNYDSSSQINGLHLFHSLSTRPLVNHTKRYHNEKAINQLWYTAWSILSAKKIFPSCLFNLHTDSLGAKLLEKLPYDNIIVDLDNLDTHLNLFASAKFVALESEPLGAIHIDGDVILTNPLAENMLNYEQNEVIVQNYEKTYLRELSLITPIIPNAYDLFGQGSFCCGIIGINNQKLKEDYINSYWKYSSILKKNSKIVDSIMESSPSVIFDLLFEQSNLYSLCVKGKYNVKRLCRNLSNVFEMRHMGISHYIAAIKHYEENITKCKAAVKEMAPEIYERLSKAEMEGLE